MNTPSSITCGFCSKPLHGRTDKKFCNDRCRNSFNNKKITETEQYPRKINGILKRNRKILSDLMDNRTLKAPTVDELINKGFNFNFHTFISKPDMVTYCYEYGYLIKSDDKIKLFYKPNLK